MIHNCSDIYKKVGRKISFYRKEKNCTQNELAEKAGISVSYLSKIEAKNCNKSFSLAVICQIANALEVDIKLFLKINNLFNLFISF
jgi:transcriptional regulator with XRE-family HTH domain